MKRKLRFVGLLDVFLMFVSSKAKRALGDSVSLNLFESRTSENVQLEETAEI